MCSLQAEADLPALFELTFEKHTGLFLPWSLDQAFRLAMEPSLCSETPNLNNFCQLASAQLESAWKQVESVYCDDFVMDENFFVQKTKLDNFSFQNFASVRKSGRFNFHEGIATFAVRISTKGFRGAFEISKLIRFMC